MNKLWLAALLLAMCATLGCRASRSQCREDYCDPCANGGRTTSGYAPFEDFSIGEGVNYGGVLPGPTP